MDWDWPSLEAEIFELRRVLALQVELDAIKTLWANVRLSDEQLTELSVALNKIMSRAQVSQLLID